MAAYAASGNELFFKHLTGALTVQLTNSTGHELHVDCITVGSTNYQLCGTRTVNLNTLSGLAPTTGTSNLTVSMYFDEVDFAIADGATREVQLPVLPVGEGHQFHVTVSYRNELDASAPTCYTLKRQQPAGLATGYSLARNQLGYIPFAAVTVEPGDATVASFATDYFNRDAVGYYKITSANSLQKFGTPEVLTANNRFGNAWNTCNFRLYADIDASGVSYTTVCGFKGTFDGAGHTIRNLAILPANDNAAYNSVNRYVCGMFSYFHYNTNQHIRITGLHLENVTLNPSSLVHYMGTIVAYVETHVVATSTTLTLENCSASNITITDAANFAGNRNIGGLVGYANNLNLCEMTNCSVSNLSYTRTATDATPDYIQLGGLIGRLNTKGELAQRFTQCTYNSTLPSIIAAMPNNIRFGGIIGYLYNETGSQTKVPLFKNCTVNISGNPTFSSITKTEVGVLAGKYYTDDYYGSVIEQQGTGNVTSGSFTAVSDSEVVKGDVNNRYIVSNTLYRLNSGTNPNLNLVIYEE